MVKISPFSGVGFQDLMTRQGLLELLGKPPFVMGSECAGKVIEVGEGVTKFKVRKQNKCLNFVKF